ncbi:MAG TPA: hypothetical protein VGS22_25075 [Thermoanaerobaculia bacterium]|jgi:hypothetical protein|nr:hypothetical protein [Thermoanaerobaculia bacterium]
MIPLLALALSCALFATPTSAATASAAPAGAPVAFVEAARHAAAGSVVVPGSFSRRALVSGIAEYSLRLRVGAGAREVIGLHRVVKETSPGQPARTAKAIFLAHGDAWGFDAAFLSAVASPAAPDARALPIYLAQRGVDVWGIDFRWTLLPADAPNLAELATWGIETDARDLGIGLVVARGVRLATGQGNRKIHLLGWSRGAQTALVYLSAESQVPAGLRQTRGAVVVDSFIKTNDADIRAAACARLAANEALLAAGQTAATSGQLFVAIGSLAETAPAGASPIVPGFTNRQVGRLAGAATYTFLPPGQSFVPLYHFTGGTFDGAGLPTGLTYTTEAHWYDFLQGASPLEPNRLLADGDAPICDATDVPFDDHLDDITVPVLYLGAGGGVGDFGIYTTTLLGSTDVTIKVVRLGPAAARALEIGHVDIFTANDAPTLFWHPLLDWIEAH